MTHINSLAGAEKHEYISHILLTYIYACINSSHTDGYRHYILYSLTKLHIYLDYTNTHVLTQKYSQTYTENLVRARCWVARGFSVFLHELSETEERLIFIVSPTSPETHYLARCGLITFKSMCQGGGAYTALPTHTKIFAFANLKHLKHPAGTETKTFFVGNNYYGRHEG